MQKVKVKSVSIKKGTNEKGEWINTRITGEDDAVFGTFHKGAAVIKEGDLIELEPIVKGRNINFEEWRMLEKALTSSTSESRNNGMSKEEWALKDRLERESIEASAAVKAVLKLAGTGNMAEDAKPVYLKSLQWCERAIDRNMATKPSAPPMKDVPYFREPQLGDPLAEECWPIFKDGMKFNTKGDFFKYFYERGVAQNDVLAALGIEKPSEITDLDTAFKKAFPILGAKMKSK